MDISIQDITEVRKAITVTIIKEEVAGMEREVYQEFVSHVRIPGFRTGKGPLQMIKQKFSKEISTELNKKLQRKAYEYVAENSGLKIYSLIKIEENKFILGADAKIIFLSDIWPIVNLPEYKNIKVDLPELIITTKDIEADIRGKQIQKAKMEKVERVAKPDDYVRVSYVGKINNQLIEEIIPENKLYGTQKNTWEKAGATDELGVKAVVEGIVGMKSGDTKTVEMEFSKEFEVTELAGKKATYDIEVHEVREQILPELDEIFFDSFKAKDLGSLEKLVEQELSQRKKAERMSSKRDQIAHFIDQNTFFSPPESAIEVEKEQILHTHIERILQHGVSREKIEIQKVKLLEEAGRLAHKNVKIRFALLEIANREKIEISKEDIWSKVLQMSYARQVATDKIVSEFQKNQELVDEMKREVLALKTLDFLCEKADSGELKELNKGKGANV